VLRLPEAPSSQAVGRRKESATARGIAGCGFIELHSPIPGPGYGETDRLLTTLWTRRVPAAELAATYHERVEIDLVLDEQETHRGQGSRRTPCGSHAERGYQECMACCWPIMRCGS